MKICFPACRENGKNYATAEEIMSLVGREPHGSWLAGTNTLWHGGIHISPVSAPGSVLTIENADTAVPLPCMAEGEIVAWRINKDYLTNDYNSNKVQYSSTFLLVKSVCKPATEKENSWIEFYSLYMGLAPLSAFPKYTCYRVTEQGDGVRMRHYNGQETTGQAVPRISGDSLKKDAHIMILRQENFLLQGKSEPFGLALLLKEGKPQGDKFWVSMRDGFLESDGEQYACLPDWMHHATAQKVFDTVVKPAEPLKIMSGDAVGFLAEDIAPVGKSKVDTHYFSHIEVISTDSRIPDFLNNTAKVTTGQEYIQIQSGKSLYQRSGEGKESIFKAMSCIMTKDGGKILLREKCNPLTDKDGKTWFEVTSRGWMSQDDVKELHQYDLKERGFTALEEEPSLDVSQTLREDWVKKVYDWFSEQVGKDRGIQQKQVSAFYKNLARKMDADEDGELSVKELYNAAHHPEMGIRNIAARLVVKHDSEWFGGSSHHRWNVFFQNYDRLRINYAKKWLDDCEWMSKVPPFDNGEPIWHMHPVVFLDALRVTESRRWAHSPFAKLLGHVESKNDYSAYNQIFYTPYHTAAKYHTNLTSMTISQVIDAQSDPNTMFATGRFQIIPSTLKEAVKSLHLDVNALYDEAMQDKIFEEYLIKVKRKPIIDYLEGNGSVEDAAYAWALEFASAGVRKGRKISKGRIAQTEGMSYYADDGLNKAHIAPDEMIRKLEESKNVDK